MNALDLLQKLSLIEQEWIMRSTHELAELIRMVYYGILGGNAVDNCFTNYWNELIQEMRDRNLTFKEPLFHKLTEV